MKQIKVYHNSHFLDYQGSHSQIIPPTQPVASVKAATELSLTERLSLAYRKTQHTDSAWFNNPDVLTHLRSTSVGDLIDDGDGNLYVVESFGFQPYRPPAVAPAHKIATACRELDEASAGGSRHVLTTAARTAVAAMQHWLAAEGYPESESPVMWEKAQPGDLVGEADGWQYRVIVRKLRPKWRARRLVAAIPGAQIWLDSPRTWAVVLPLGRRRSQ